MRAADIRGDGAQSVGHRNIPAVSTDRVPFPSWGEREIARFKFRAALFQRRGLSPADAETWADRLFERDFERDDRRVCLECEHIQRSGQCFAAAQGWMLPGTPKRYEPVTTQLQRCEAFSFQKP